MRRVLLLMLLGSPVMAQDFIEYTICRENTAAPATPPTGRAYIYCLDKAGVTTLYWKDESGAVYDLSATGGGGAPSTAKYVTAANDAGLSADIFPSAADQVPVTSTSTAASWTGVPDCDDSVGNHLNYDTTAHTFSCGTSSSGGSTPTGTGYRHVTAGVEDAASDLVTLTSATDVAANQGTTTTVLHGNAAGQASFASVVSADMNITTTSCTNQFVTAIGSGGVGTCTTDTLASAQHANQGTTTTLLHGNAAGNPSFGSVVSADLNITTTSCAAGSAVNAVSSGGVGTCDANVAFDDEANTFTLNQTLADGVTDTPWLVFTPQTGTSWNLYADDAADDMNIATNTAATENVNILNLGAGVANLTVEGTSGSTNYPVGAADDQVLVASSATAGSWRALPNGAVAYGTAFNTFTQAGVSHLAASTSADLRGVLSDESGTGAALFAGATGVGLHRTLVTLGGDVGSTASTSFQTITGLSWAVANGTVYRYECYIIYTASANTIGLRVSYTSPATTLAAYTTTVTPPSTTGGVPAAGVAINWDNWQTANDSGTTSGASMNTSAGNLLIMHGIIQPSAAGTMQIRFAPETATSNGIVIKTGSTCEYW